MNTFYINLLRHIGLVLVLLLAGEAFVIGLLDHHGQAHGVPGVHCGGSLTEQVRVGGHEQRAVPGRGC